MLPQHVALVGPAQQENLALEYLAASAESQGHRAELVRFDTRQDLELAIRTIIELDPHLVGFGIAFQYAIDDYLELARALRHRGYSGHITCGGHVPTFCYEQVLGEAREIDTVVRHEGEETLTEMLAMLGNGDKPRGIPGLVWREAGEVVVGPTRPLNTDLDKLPLPRRRSEPLVVGGVPLAFMITSRGCIGECAYCSIRAFSREFGGPRFRIRDTDAVADEIATLYHESGIRVILVQDDLFILPDEKKTVDRLRKITRAIRERGVDEMLFWIKGRPEAITTSVVEAAREMGTIHLFLGVENASLDRLKYLGRFHSPDDNVRAISLCLDSGIRPSFNFMLFDPDCTLADIALTLDFGEQYLHVPWNVCRTEIYSGTRLLDRLKKEGRLEGDFRTYGYQMKDLAAEIMFRIMRISFQSRSFSFDSLLNKLISLSFARQVHEELWPSPGTDAMSAKVDKLVVEVYRDTVSELRRIMAFASTADFDDLDKMRDFAVETAVSLNERDHPWLTRTEQLFTLLDARGARIRRFSES